MTSYQIYSTWHFRHFTVLLVNLSWEGAGAWNSCIYTSHGALSEHTLLKGASVMLCRCPGNSPYYQNTFHVCTHGGTKNPLLPCAAPHRLRRLLLPYLFLTDINCPIKLLLVLTFRVSGIKICFFLLPS